jgi:hypothetical protein
MTTVWKKERNVTRQQKKSSVYWNKNTEKKNLNPSSNIFSICHPFKWQRRAAKKNSEKVKKVSIETTNKFNLI